MVLEEMVAHQARAYMDARDATRDALNQLRRTMPWQSGDGPVEASDLELEECQDHWRTQYSELFEVVDTSGESARRAFVR
ncbi:hypothetical protein [Kitasatospora cinereorecta]|uniref:TipAS antibiotic-recognition domain-containing protein n=1 Tax=Kitasatospora cinereorecta TaxID=285560 RepID=A0ABW0VD56_9ACTN